jgi:hypothetical protein
MLVLEESSAARPARNRRSRTAPGIVWITFRNRRCLGTPRAAPPICAASRYPGTINRRMQIRSICISAGSVGARESQGYARNSITF